MIFMETAMKLGRAVPLVAALAWSTSTSATLFIEPVINHFPGSGPGADVFPLYDPTYINEATGEQVSIARKPGEIDSWSMGYPREEAMVTFGMHNNTAYNLTSLTMTIVGSSFQPTEEAWFVTRDPNVDAFFGDANGDGKVGLSDIFGTITVSNGGRTITLSDGVIPANGHFTDYVFSRTTDGLPFQVGAEGTFDGVHVPEPATWMLLLGGFGAALVVGRRRRSGRSVHGSPSADPASQGEVVVNRPGTLVHRYCAALALAAACLGGAAIAGPIGPPKTFQNDAVGSFPAGWSDVATVDPASTTPKPSSVVVSTIDAFGHPTKAVSTLPKVVGTLPTTAPSEGIYRPIVPSSHYSMNADVRIDRFSDVTDFDCGCPPDAKSASDLPMGVGFSKSQGTTDLTFAPNVAVYASARTHGWRLFSATSGFEADFDLGVPVDLGTWYGVQVDLNANAGTVHSRITDTATGSVLDDRVTMLSALWDPARDGVFDLESLFGVELTAISRSGLATIDNIDTPIPEPATIVLLASALALGALVRRRT